jgi:membrane protease subunit HflC
MSEQPPSPPDPPAEAAAPPATPEPTSPSPWGARLQVGALVGLLAWSVLGSVYTLDAREVGIVTMFGATVRTLTEPGLYLRAPWPLHEVIRIDRRARLLAVPPTDLLTKDKKNLVVEPFIVWRVEDPGRFIEAVGSAAAAETQLSDLVVSRIASSLGQREFTELVEVGKTEATLLSPELRSALDEVAVARLGVRVLELRLKHLGLPLQNEQSIYERMRAERSRIANAYRSEGEERAASIRAEADRQAAELRAQAEEDAARIEATGEAEAARLYAEAYVRDPELFLLMRQLSAYEASLDEDDVVVISSDSEAFRALREGR